MIRKLAVALILASLLTGNVLAEGSSEPEGSFPNDTITVIIPFGVGGNLDLKARLIAQYLEEDLGVPVVVENKPGAAGIVGSSEFLVDEPTGYQMILLNDGALILASLVNGADFTPADFTPVIGVDTVYSVLLSNPAQTGITDYDSLVEYGRENGLVFSSQGPATVQFMAQKTLFNELGLSSESLQSASQNEAIAQVLGGSADVSVIAETRAATYVEEGELAAIVNFSNEAMIDYAGMAELASVADIGYGELSFESFNFLACKAGVSEDEVDILYEAIAAVYENPAFQEEMAKLAKRPLPIDGQSVAERVNNARGRIVTMQENLQ